MDRLVNKLSALKVANISTRGWYSDGNGLWLQVSASGSKSWVLRVTSLALAIIRAWVRCATYRWHRNACRPRMARAGCEVAAIH